MSQPDQEDQRTRIRAFISWAHPDDPSLMKSKLGLLGKLESRIQERFREEGVDFNLITDFERNEADSWVHELRCFAEKCEIALIVCDERLEDKMSPESKGEKGWIVENELLPLQERFDLPELKPRRVFLLGIPFQAVPLSALRCSDPEINLFDANRSGASGPVDVLEKEPFPDITQEMIDQGATSEVVKWRDKVLLDRVAGLVKRVLKAHDARQSERLPPRVVEACDTNPLWEFLIEALWHEGRGSELCPVAGETAVEKWRMRAGLTSDKSEDFFWNLVESLHFHKEPRLIEAKKSAETIQECDGFFINPELVMTRSKDLDKEETEDGSGSQEEAIEELASGGSSKGTKRPSRAQNDLREWIKGRSGSEPFTRITAGEELGFNVYLYWLEQLVDEGLLEECPVPASLSGRGKGRPPKHFKLASADDRSETLGDDAPVSLAAERRAFDEWIASKSVEDPPFSRLDVNSELGFQVPQQWLKVLEDNGTVREVKSPNKKSQRGRRRGRPVKRYRVARSADSSDVSQVPSGMTDPESLNVSQQKVVAALSKLARESNDGWVQGLDRIAEVADLSYFATSRVLGELRRLDPPAVLADGETRKRRFRLNDGMQAEVPLKPIDLETSREEQGSGITVPPSLQKLLDGCNDSSQRTLVGLIYDETIDRAEGIESIAHIELKDLAERQMSQRQFYDALDYLVFSEPAAVLEVNTSTSKRYALNL